MGKIVVIGSSNTDMVITSSKMPLPGETVMGNDFSIIPGGKGANQAVACARAGAETTFIAKVGNDDFGRKAIEGYVKDKIDTQHIWVDDKKPTGVAVIIVDENTGQNSIVVAAGSNAELLLDDIQQLEEVIAKADVLLVQLEIPIQSVELALKIAKKAHVLTILNPAPAQFLSNKILSYVDIITPNETEIAYLLGRGELQTESDIKEAAQQLLVKVNQSVIITLGSKGVYFKNKHGASGFMNTNKVNAIDTTAAGDVFNGYLAAALSRKIQFPDALKWANKAASISVTRKGAQPSVPYLNEVD